QFLPNQSVHEFRRVLTAGGTYKSYRVTAHLVRDLKKGFCAAGTLDFHTLSLTKTDNACSFHYGLSSTTPWVSTSENAAFAPDLWTWPSQNKKFPPSLP